MKRTKREKIFTPGAKLLCGNIVIAEHRIGEDSLIMIKNDNPPVVLTPSFVERKPMISFPSLPNKGKRK